MVAEWWGNEAASHGFLIPPIAGFLAWRKRREVAAVARVWPAGLWVAALGLLLYPAGVFSAVDFLPQVSFVVALGGVMLYALGPAASRLLAFPYAFLWFMIPWPDTLVEFVSFPMQLFSARFAAMLTGLAGIPVSRDGVDIHLPRYTFSVGVPCSGMKSLVALLALSALVAYLLSGPRWKRWALFAAGLPLALLANVLRIVCILVIATIWGAKAAEGFFHGFSGIVVFLFATLGLVAVGRALGLRQASALTAAGTEGGEASGGAARPSAGCCPSPALQPRPATWGSLPGQVSRQWRVLAAPLVMMALTGALAWGLQRSASAAPSIRPDFSRVPMRVAAWQGRDMGPLDRTSQEMLHPDAYMGRLYVRGDGYPVDLAVVFGHEKETFHSPGFCLLGGGWNIIQKSRRSVDRGSGRRLLANEFRLQRRDERRVVLYWYASYRETTPSWVALQYRLLRNRVLGRPTGGALIRVTAPVGESEEAASRVAEELIRALYGDLSRVMAL
jgi:EpsI family protein